MIEWENLHLETFKDDETGEISFLLWVGDDENDNFGSASGESEFKLIRYTGLKDKDGREVYEGELVEYTRIVYADCSRTEIEDVEEPIIGEIYYAEGLWLGVRFIDGTGKLFLPGQVFSEEYNPEIKVIGNVYENPDLI